MSSPCGSPVPRRHMAYSYKNAGSPVTPCTKPTDFAEAVTPAADNAKSPLRDQPASPGGRHADAGWGQAAGESSPYRSYAPLNDPLGDDPYDFVMPDSHLQGPLPPSHWQSKEWGDYPSPTLSGNTPAADNAGAADQMPPSYASDQVYQTDSYSPTQDAFVPSKAYTGRSNMLSMMSLGQPRLGDDNPFEVPGGSTWRDPKYKHYPGSPPNPAAAPAAAAGGSGSGTARQATATTKAAAAAPTAPTLAAVKASRAAVVTGGNDAMPSTSTAPTATHVDSGKAKAAAAAPKPAPPAVPKAPVASVAKAAPPAVPKAAPPAVPKAAPPAVPKAPVAPAVPKAPVAPVPKAPAPVAASDSLATTQTAAAAGMTTRAKSAARATPSLVSGQGASTSSQQLAAASAAKPLLVPGAAAAGAARSEAAAAQAQVVLGQIQQTLADRVAQVEPGVYRAKRPRGGCCDLRTVEGSAELRAAVHKAAQCVRGILDQLAGPHGSALLTLQGLLGEGPVLQRQLEDAAGDPTWALGAAAEDGAFGAMAAALLRLQPSGAEAAAAPGAPLVGGSWPVGEQLEAMRRSVANAPGRLVWRGEDARISLSSVDATHAGGALARLGSLQVVAQQLISAPAAPVQPRQQPSRSTKPPPGAFEELGRSPRQRPQQQSTQQQQQSLQSQCPSPRTPSRSSQQLQMHAPLSPKQLQQSATDVMVLRVFVDLLLVLQVKGKELKAANYQCAPQPPVLEKIGGGAEKLNEGGCWWLYVAGVVWFPLTTPVLDILGAFFFPKAFAATGSTTIQNRLLSSVGSTPA